jgi:anti-sigma factor RsiW
MTDVSREHLHAYLDDALSDAETARLESLLRASEPLRTRLREVLLGVLDPELQDYVEFHLKTVGCPFCQANLDDLRDHAAEPAPKKQRRKRYYESSAGLLRKR